MDFLKDMIEGIIFYTKVLVGAVIFSTPALGLYILARVYSSWLIGIGALVYIIVIAGFLHAVEKKKNKFAP